MKLLPILSKFPKWGVAAGIVAISSGIFFSWLIFRGGGESRPAPVVEKEGGKQVGAFSSSDVVLCGNTLVDFKSGEILARQWIEGAGDSQPPIAGLAYDEQLVLISNRGMTMAFGFDGKPRAPVSESGKRLSGFAVNDVAKEIVFPRDGDLWKGTVDWVTSEVSEARKVTDTGFFRDNVFQGGWFWVGDDIYLSVLGRPHVVELTSGSIKPGQPPVDRFVRGASPDKTLAVLAVNPGELVVAEFGTSALKRFPTLGELKGVRWLSKKRVAVLGGYRRISVYDHESGKVTGNYEQQSQIQAFGSASPDGKRLLIATAKGIQILETESGRFTTVKIPVAGLEWVSNDALLGSNPGTDTEARGLWLIGTDGKAEKVSGHPLDTSLKESNPIVRVGDGVIFVSKGDLWVFKAADKSLRQVTRGEKLPSNLRILK